MAAQEEAMKMGGVTVGPRQFNMMAMGTQCGNGGTTAPWEVCPIDAAVGHGYYYQTKLDLRALTADPKTSRGINLTSLSLQESGPFDTTGGETEQGFIIFDMLTTSRLSEDMLFEIWNGMGNPGWTPGFLPPALFGFNTDTPGMTPSQVIWGYWRLFGMDRNIVLGSGNGVCKPQTSSFFGDGEILVGPQAYWTRFIATIANATQVVVPAANMTCYAEMVSLTEPQEMTQMIRSVGL